MTYKPNLGIHKEMELASLLKDLKCQMAEYNNLCRKLDNISQFNDHNDAVLNVLKKKFEIVANNIATINMKIKKIQCK
jgi:hypothetical protein